MLYGAAIFPTDYSMHPADLGRALEERGFESLWVAEHSHIPVERVTPWPGGAELPKMYHDVADPFVSLSMAASTTTTLKLATGICLVVQRDPIQTAKQVASLDHFSGGRFLFGVGGGWNAEEMANHGTAFHGRWKLLRERIEAMKAIWTQSEAEYHGEYVDFDPIQQWPKPAQKPHPPIHVGGAAPGGARRAVRYGDGWIPLAGRGGDILDELPVLAAEADKAGRDVTEIEVSMYYAPTDPAGLERLRDGGVHRVVFGLPPKGDDELLPYLDRLADVMSAVG
ncbi:MAG: LLM class F420-dependent oxidoreductase [Acidimicrobiia bacterium]|nr:LLM class F420-dependent oxidoreductase [Acidimicrobiia bacterium]MDH5236926.1 LLM class F420-dependent oxidoreductase [Acidimicrobiia bacterium]